MTTQDFNDWLARMGLDRQGGQKEAAALLGVNVATVRSYAEGRHADGRAVNYPRMLALACSALAMSLPPWGQQVTQLHR